MSKIFVSHSSLDDIFAKRLSNSLQYDFGAEVWADFKDIKGGMEWSSSIQEALDECGIMILIISPEAIASRNVRPEWQYFRDKGKILIPVIWRPIENWPYELPRIQHIVFYAQDYEAAFKELSSALKYHGIESDKPSTPDPVNRQKTGNLFWLCHDSLELHRWLLTGVPKQWIDIGFRQCYHHARELGLDQGIVIEFREIRDSANEIVDWSQVKRMQYANEVKILFNKVAQIAQGADPTFNSGPG